MKTILPLQTGGGLFFICIGAGLIAGGWAGGFAIFTGLIAGALAGAAAVVLSIKPNRRRFGKPKKLHIAVMYGAIAFEIAAFYLFWRLGYFRHAMDFTNWALALAIVAVHFIPMRWSHGSWMIVLAAAVLMWIGTAYLLKATPELLVMGDGILKVLVGLVMAAPLLLAKPQAPQP